VLFFIKILFKLEEVSFLYTSKSLFWNIW